MQTSDFEKLGLFYLGTELAPDSRQPTGSAFCVDARDLTTHAVVLGMTGSGKTGLATTLIEEAAIDGIPSIVIDPKGDLACLALAFPELRASDFLPWIDRSDAERRGLTAEALAEQVAARWASGLAGSAQDGDRVRRLQQAADVVVYTPGASFGRPLALLSSFDAPPASLSDGDRRERAVSSASGLLGLAGVETSLQSRELLLISTLLETAWASGKGLVLADIVRSVAEPPFSRVGLFDLESFFPAKERFQLALALNALIASPGFSAWTEGEALDVARLLRSPTGRPQVAVLSIAHLSDAQRMFFVTALLTEVVAWMRSQPGASTLRALLYMDEIFGYFPPVAAPPSKAPMLTLLKQARAFGLGVVLATQNPVDLDYRGLGNTGLWLIGRLQTARDKARVLDGLEGAAAVAGARFDRGALDALVGSLEPRQFLAHSVHQDEPAVLASRWALTYLAGPLSREQLGRLSSSATVARHPPKAPPARVEAAGERPVLPPGVSEFFVAGGRAYTPGVLASGKVHLTSAKAGIDTWRTVALVAPLGEDGVDWGDAEELPPDTTLDRVPGDGARFAALPAVAARTASYATWQKAFVAHVFETTALTLWKCAALKATSRPEETEADFRARLAGEALSARDEAVAKLRKKYATKVVAAEARVAKARDRVGRESAQASASQVDTAVTVGSSLIGALFGSWGVRSTMGRARTAARSATRAVQQRADVGRAEEELARTEEALAALVSEVEAAVGEVAGTFSAQALALDPIEVRPKKSDVTVAAVALIWRG